VVITVFNKDRKMLREAPTAVLLSLEAAGSFVVFDPKGPRASGAFAEWSA
jgi:hypothetical protein